MRLNSIKEDFITALQDIYPLEEAENIWYLTIEHLTEIDFRKNRDQKFEPDGCFINMISDIKKRLLKCEPIQYILNKAWFYDLPFYVDKNVLIPRPETEELTDWIIKENHAAKEISILDAGTGSGCIPVILKRKMSAATVIACDISAAAISVAQKNAVKHKTQIQFIQTDILDNNSCLQLPRVDVIVSNPPYIPQSDQHSMHQNVLQYEPHHALFVPGADPLIFYTAIARLGRRILTDKGKIYVEIHEKSGNATQAVFEQAGYRTVLKKDIQGKDRFIKCELI